MSVRIPINLASEPFRKDRPILVASAATGVLLLGVLILLVTTIVQQRDAARESREQLDKLEQQLKRVNREHQQLEAKLREPLNAAVLDRSVFLNSLLLRKGVSWTKLFEDLEQVFPGSVRLVVVRPYITSENLIQLDMVVGSQSPQPLIELMKRLENSKTFGAVALLSSQPPTQNDPLYRYRVSVNYAQKL